MKIKNQNRIKKKKSPPKSLSQQKSKSKPKNLPFNPLQYLNALIELTNDTNALKVKKSKVPQKRDLSSALTIATPAMQKTISTSKIRCKSSYSQYRKKSTTSNVNNLNAKNLNQVLDLNVNNYIITEEEDTSNCIKFTSISSSNNSRQHTPMGQKDIKQEMYLKQIQPKLKHLSRQSEFSHLFKEVDYDYYARKIQRAWRSFQTYKVIHKYYRQFKRQRREEKYKAEEERRLQYAPRASMHGEVQHGEYREQQQQAPSVYGYLNNYNDISIGQNSNQLISAHEELLQRTIKFKIRNSQHPQDHPNHHDKVQQRHQHQNKSYHLKGENSESQNQLNLTQKLNQIKQYIDKQCKKEQHLPQMAQTPTVQIKKSTRPHSHNYPQQSNSITKKQLQEEDNDSTEKKHNLPLTIKIPKHPQQNSSPSQLNQFTLNQSLDRSPTLKQDFTSSMKKQTPQHQLFHHSKHASLVDSMIKKETEKYNQILSLIELCKTDQTKQNKNAPNILTEVLKKLEQHKSELQRMEGNKQENSLSKNVKQMSEKGKFEKSFVKEGSSCGNNSFLAFESKDIYYSFEDYEFNSEEKLGEDANNDTGNKRGSSNIQQEKSHQQVKFLGQNGQVQKVKRIQSPTINRNLNDNSERLRRFSSLLDEEEHKLTQLIKSSKKQQQISIQDLPSEASSQSSQFDLSHQFSRQFNQAEPQKQYKQQEKQAQLQPEQISFDQQDENSSIYSFCSSECQSDAANKMFIQHLNLITLKKEKSIQNLNKLIEQNKIPQESFQAKIKQIEQKFSLQRKSIQTKKQQYIKSLKSVKKQALQFQKDLLASSKNLYAVNGLYEDEEAQRNRKYSSLAIRKSFSAESIVLKCILKQPVLTTKDIVQERFLIRQKEIDGYDESDQSEYEEGQDFDNHERDYIGKMLRPGSEMKIDHKQNIILSQDKKENTFKNEFLDQSQLLQAKEISNSDLLMVDAGLNESKQLASESVQRVRQHSNIVGNERKYVQCDEVWVNVNNPIPFQAPEQQESNQVSISNNQSDDNDDNPNNQQEQHLDYLQQTKSEHSKDQQLIDAYVQQASQHFQESNLLSKDSPRLSSSCALMQRCSQELQQLIQTQLINELLQTIYINDSMLTLFRPFIQEIFQFTLITDSTIINFLQQDLPKYFPPFSQLIQRANQKINPTSIQILRLVRDFDYEIDQYELILSEDIFKNVRKSIELQYQQKIQLKNQLPINPSTDLTNQLVVEKVKKRELQKRAKVQKYLGYERDMKIMYMKAVFNCMNEFLIEQKSIATHVNTRSTIGTGELSLSIKEFNIQCQKEDVEMFFTKTKERMRNLLNNKCMIPSFKNYKEVGLFQKQMLKMIKSELDENEYKWVTYMDEVLEIWNQTANQICDDIFLQATYEIMLMKEKQLNI